MVSFPPLSLYVHIPWCLKKCPYCDFNSHASPLESIPEQAYVHCLIKDLQADMALAQGRPLQSVFFGGGTPSMFSPDAIRQIIEAITENFSCVDGMEITLEANPGTFELQRFAGFKAAGVNRLSIGVQRFSYASLKQLGRVHSANQAHDAIQAAGSLGFAHLNIDLMHGLPQQTPAMALTDLQQALAGDYRTFVDHVSWYQLTLEPNTLFHSQPPKLPCDDDLASIQDTGGAWLTSQGFVQYEISAWSLPSCLSAHKVSETSSQKTTTTVSNQAQHNLNYWQFGDYLGVGAGAHSKVTTCIETDDKPILSIQRRSKLRQPKAYMQALNYVANSTTVPAHNVPLEFFMNALRLREGVPETLFTQRTGLHLQDVKALAVLRKKGLIQPHTLAATDLGWRFLNNVLAEFE